MTKLFKFKRSIKKCPRVIGAGFVIGALALAMVIPFMSAPDAEAATLCSLSPQTNRTIINFENKKIWSGKTVADASANSTNYFSLSAGEYNVTLASYDSHPDGTDQPLETWYVKLKNSGGTVVASTPAIEDLPQHKSHLVRQVATSFLIPETITSAVAFHAAYKTTGANTVFPVCAAFDKIEDPTTPNITISKLGRNLTKGYSSWQETVSAEPGDEIEFSIKIDSTGDATAENVNVRDYLPNKLSYVSGSTHGDTTLDITSGWRNLGDISPGDSKIIYFTAKIFDKDYFSVGSTTLTNVAKTYADDIWTIEDTAVVLVDKDSDPEDDPDLSIEKLARNLSRGYSTWRNSVDAEPGDEIEFSIKIESTGDGDAENVYVRDYLPGKLDYISGSTHGATTSNITSGWKAIGDIPAGSSKTIYFTTRVFGETYFSTTSSETLVNEVKTYADEVTTREDTARVFVRGEESESAMDIIKLGKNISTGQISFSEQVSAEPNHTIEFSIQVTNIGNATINNLKVWDSLPNNLEYISGSTTVDGSYHSDGVIGSGIYVGSISPGQNKTVKFRTKVASLFAFSGSNATTINISNHTIQTSSGVSISKLGRNISQGQTDWSASVLANVNDELEFSVKVTNVSNNNLSNVKLSETLPANLSLVPNSTSVDSLLLGGDITGAGLNLGTLNKGQEKTIKFRARVITGTGVVITPTTLVNTAYASANNISTIQDQASVTVSKTGQVLGATTIATGPAETLILSLIISLFASLIAYFVIKNKAQLKLRFVVAKSRFGR